MPISCIAARPRDAVADAVAALVDTTPLGSWSGTIPELYAALDAVTLAADRAALDWPATAAALAARVPALVDALWAHRLRLTRTPGDLVVERMGTAA